MVIALSKELDSAALVCPNDAGHTLIPKEEPGEYKCAGCEEDVVPVVYLRDVLELIDSEIEYWSDLEERKKEAGQHEAVAESRNEQRRYALKRLKKLITEEEFRAGSGGD